MKKLKTLQLLMEAGVVAVVRGRSAEEAINISRHAISGGIRAVEIAMTVPNALNAIASLTAECASEGVVIGAGSVLDPETARAAILCGAEFIVSPSLYENTVILCNRYRVPVIPGAVTLREMQKALEMGVDIIKLFPANQFSPSLLRAVKGPLPQANLMPTGGITPERVGEWIAAGAAAVGVGSELTKGVAPGGDDVVIAKRASLFMRAYREAKQNAANQ
ncbi:ketohydroxyglutarate aldolase [Thermoactinomyces vulgaris]|nr:ketohydroxyglutarate aldolase [Thermoactinomyces vulgaris]